MTTTKTVTLYTFDELSERAKENARDWWRSTFEWDEFYTDGIIDDFTAACKIIGIDVSRCYLSGFWSQGGGASFEGCYSYKKGALAAIRKEFPQWYAMHDATKALQEIQRKYFYGISCNISQRGRYCHEHTMYGNFSLYIKGQDNRSYDGIPDDVEEEIMDVFRDLASELYKRLEQEYEYQTSDEAIAEAMFINEYTFDEEGNRED